MIELLRWCAQPSFRLAVAAYELRAANLASNPRAEDARFDRAVNGEKRKAGCQQRRSVHIQTVVLRFGPWPAPSDRIRSPRFSNIP